ncbi:hypothetical protein HDV00_003339 [Rhizophlyctis rosea]|nr:hypothetical protein HDV00_003339 [Rhizophlyctis rosea]
MSIRHLRLIPKTLFRTYIYGSLTLGTYEGFWWGYKDLPNQPFYQRSRGSERRAWDRAGDDVDCIIHVAGHMVAGAVAGFMLFPLWVGEQVGDFGEWAGLIEKGDESGEGQ